MSTTTLVYQGSCTLLLARSRDYLELTKPKIAVLELVTVAVAEYLASYSTGMGHADWRSMLWALWGTALVAAGASAFNQWIERHADARMERTAHRPLPGGRLRPGEVLSFGAATTALGLVHLAVAVNVLTAALGLATWLLYVCVYTPLKSRSVANTAIGAVAGALPVLIGWTAAGARLNAEAAMLFVLMFLWQFPHFMAIAWLYKQQYRAAGMKMLPVVDETGRRAGRQAVLAAAALVPVSLVPALVSFAGPLYCAAATLVGLWQLGTAAAFCRRLDEPTARRLLKASLVYLPVQLALLLCVPLI